MPAFLVVFACFREHEGFWWVQILKVASRVAMYHLKKVYLVRLTDIIPTAIVIKANGGLVVNTVPRVL
jgi:hypothetical protein